MKRGAEIGKSIVCSLKRQKTWSARDGSLNGRPRRKRSLIKLKMAVLRPIPSARVIKARRVNPGALINCRKAKRTSVIIIILTLKFGCSDPVMWIQPREVFCNHRAKRARSAQTADSVYVCSRRQFVKFAHCPAGGIFPSREWSEPGGLSRNY